MANYTYIPLRTKIKSGFSSNTLEALLNGT